MSATLTPSRQDVALSALLEEFTDAETQRLVRGAIERALSQGRYLDKCQAMARDVAASIDSRVHCHAPGDTDPLCIRCFDEHQEQVVLRTVDRQRLLLMGKAVAA